MPNIHAFAVECVTSMGDIFWDYQPERDDSLEFSDPFDIAVECVEETIRKALGS